MAYASVRDALVLVGCVALVGCGDAESSDDNTQSTQTQSASDSGSASDGDPTTADEGTDDAASATQSSTDPSLTQGETSADSSETDPTATDDSATGTDSTTGEEQFCGLADLGGGAWFELSHHEMPLAAGDTLTMECGGQGALMLLISTTQGGWLPLEETIYYSVTIDVEGFVGPTGHFFENTMYGIYVGCDQIDGGFAPSGIAVFPLDGVDVHMLDGLSATVHIELLAGDNPTWDGELTLEVPDDGTLDQCGEFG